MFFLQACEGTDAVPPNARSHTVLLSGKFPGGESALARLQFGQDPQRQVCLSLSTEMTIPCCCKLPSQAAS